MIGAAEITILDASAGPALPLVDGEGAAHAVVWPGTGARARSLHRVRLGAGARTVEQRHPSEAVYYVLGGDGEVLDRSTGEVHPLRRGAMFHVEPETAYVAAAGTAGMELVGGPAPADDALYAHLAAER